MATPKWKAILEKRKAEKDANDVKSFKIPMGKTTMRILPNPKDPDEPFFQDFGQHWIKDKNEKNAQGRNKIVGAPLCMDKTFEKSCAYCDAISEALGHMDDNDHHFSDDDKKLIDEAKARHRVLVNAAIRNGAGYEVKMVELASTAFGALIDLISEYGEEVVATEGGIDVVFNRTGSGINTQYTAMPAKDHGADIAGDWTSSAVDLGAFVRAQIPNEQRANTALEGIGKIADMKLSAPALGAPTTAKALPNAKYGSSESVLDDGIDEELEDELDDIPFETEKTEVVEEAEVVEEEPVKAAEKPTPTTDASDDDLLSELDALDDL